jgi:hypothetical protein
MQAQHIGGQLSPPFSKARLQQLPPMQATEVSVRGDLWESNSTDIAVAGLGWLSVACRGTADFVVHAPAGVAITKRSALVAEYNADLERPGFSCLLPGKGA